MKIAPHLNRPLSLLLPLTLLAGSALAQATFTAVPRENVNPSFTTFGLATDLSSDGQYLAWFGATSAQTDTWEGFRFDRNTGFSSGTSALELGANFYSEASAISGDGNVIAGLSQVGIFANRAFARIYSTGATFELTDLPGGSGSLATFANAFAVNEDGTRIGGYGVPAGNVITAALWTVNLAAGTSTVAAVPGPAGLSGRSQITGIADADGTLRLAAFTGSGAARRAWVRVGASAPVTLPNPGNETGYNESFGFSRDGTTITGALTERSLIVPGTWRLVAGTYVAEALPTLGSGGGVAFDASNLGDRIVGSSGGIAVIWEDGIVADLAARLTAAGATLPDGAILTEATAISRDGTIIAGNFNLGVGTPSEAFTATLPLSTPACPADIGGEGGAQGPDGTLDNNDFIVFIQLFFDQNPLADIGSEGGAEGSDNSWDNNDFIVFIQRFFAGC